MQAELRNHVRYVTLYRRRFNAEDQGRRGWKIWRAKSQRKWFTRVKVTPQDVEGWFPHDSAPEHKPTGRAPAGATYLSGS